MKAESQKEHQWLERLIGEWTQETEAAMGADTVTEKQTGTSLLVSDEYSLDIAHLQTSVRF